MNRLHYYFISLLLVSATTLYSMDVQLDRKSLQNGLDADSIEKHADKKSKVAAQKAEDVLNQVTQAASSASSMETESAIPANSLSAQAAASASSPASESAKPANAPAAYILNTKIIQKYKPSEYGTSIVRFLSHSKIIVLTSNNTIDIIDLSTGKGFTLDNYCDCSVEDVQVIDAAHIAVFMPGCLHMSDPHVAIVRIEDSNAVETTKIRLPYGKFHRSIIYSGSGNFVASEVLNRSSIINAYSGATREIRIGWDLCLNDKYILGYNKDLISLIDRNTLQKVQDLELDAVDAFTPPAYSFLATEDAVVVGTATNKLMVYDIKTGKCKQSITLPEPALGSIDNILIVPIPHSPLVLFYNCMELYLWDMNTNHYQKICDAHIVKNCIIPAADGKSFRAVLKQGTIREWQIEGL